MIRLFVFDLGNVILPFEHRQIAEKLCAKCKKPWLHESSEVFQYLFDLEYGLVNAYEEGTLSSAEFFGRIRDRYDLDLTFNEFAGIWNPIFREDQAVSNLILYLKGRGFPLFLLSNTNELHFSHIIEHYPIVHVLDEWILSFEVGVKKPQRRIYDAIFEKMDVRRDEVLYVDDVEAYVEAARSYGINSMVFKGAGSLWEMLKANSI